MFQLVGGICVQNGVEFNANCQRPLHPQDCDTLEECPTLNTGMEISCPRWSCTGKPKTTPKTFTPRKTTAVSSTTMFPTTTRASTMGATTRSLTIKVSTTSTTAASTSPKMSPLPEVSPCKKLVSKYVTKCGIYLD